ncbi:MAG TPA: hypothetical protein VFD03_00810 [Clostridia bacterium]|nr:hypothetical protein [Clostridia bacterium]
MMAYLIYSRIFGIIIIILGCLCVTRKKIIISQQYYMIFLYTLICGGIAVNTIWKYQSLLIIAVFYLFSIIIAYDIMKGIYNITNIKTETLMPVITNLLDEKGIVYEVRDNSVVFTNYDNKEIKCKEFLNSTEINFRDIIRLPFYGDVKDSLLSKVKLIKETVFPTTGVYLIMMGIILIVVVQLIVNLIR